MNTWSLCNSKQKNARRLGASVLENDRKGFASVGRFPIWNDALDKREIL